MQKLLNAITFTAIFLLFSMAAFSQGISPLQVNQIHNVGASVISSDGEFIAYTLVVPANPLTENRGASVKLRYIGLETGEETAVELSANPIGLSARPGTGTFTFLTRMDGDSVNGLYELNPQTGELVKLFSHEVNMLGYVWDEAGRNIGFMANEQLNLPKYG